MAKGPCNCVEFPVDFEEMDSEFPVIFKDMETEFPTIFEDLTVIDNSIKDHPDLNKRDLPDQHPIKAVTSLSEELAARPSAFLTNFDIFQIISQ